MTSRYPVAAQKRYRTCLLARVLSGGLAYRWWVMLQWARDDSGTQGHAVAAVTANDSPATAPCWDASEDTASPQQAVVGLPLAVTAVAVLLLYPAPPSPGCNLG